MKQFSIDSYNYTPATPAYNKNESLFSPRTAFSPNARQSIDFSLRSSKDTSKICFSPRLNNFSPMSKNDTSKKEKTMMEKVGDLIKSKVK